eukprot:1965257-Pleurochrysis_carterae.AAC.7
MLRQKEQSPLGCTGAGTLFARSLVGVQPVTAAADWICNPDLPDFWEKSSACMARVLHFYSSTGCAQHVAGQGQGDVCPLPVSSRGQTGH